MKIKCPICKQEPESNDVKGMCEHLTDYHKWENILINEYAKLIVKIHEKIEYWENEQKKANYNVYINEIELLKSLLEDKN